jgi:hypothetical protein
MKDAGSPFLLLIGKGVSYCNRREDFESTCRRASYGKEMSEMRGHDNLNGNQNPVDAKIGNDVWPSITFNCPYCFTILGAQVDPIAIKIDTVREILEALRK